MNIKKIPPIIAIVAIALFARLTLATLQIDEGGTIPHEPAEYEYCNVVDTLPVDFTFFVCVGQRLLAGKTIYNNYSIYKENYQSLNYPPAFPLLVAGSIYLFDINFLVIKSIAIAFDVGGIVLIYLIGKRVYGERTGTIAAILYSFFFTALISTSMHGNDDHGFMFMTLLAVYLVLDKRYSLSALFIGLGIFFKAATLVYIPPILYYIYRQKRRTDMMKYAVVSAVTALALLAPFFASEGVAILEPYFLTGSDVDGLGFMNLARLTYGLPYHAMNPGMLLRDKNVNDPMNLITGVHPFARALKASAFPLRIIAFLAVASYVFRRRLENNEEELLRNLVILVAAICLVNNGLYDFYFMWFIPLALILLTKDAKKDSKSLWAGAMLTYLAVAMYGTVWTQQYFRPMSEVYSVTIAAVLATCGGWLMYGILDARKRRIFTALTFISAYVQVQHALPMRIIYFLFDDFIGLETFRRLNIYGILYVIIILTIATITLLMIEVHRQTRKS